MVASLVAVGFGSKLVICQSLLLDVVQLVDALLTGHELAHRSADHHGAYVRIALPRTPLFRRNNLQRGETSLEVQKNKEEFASGYTLAMPHLCAPWSSIKATNAEKSLNCSIVGEKHITPPGSIHHDMVPARRDATSG